MLFIKIFLQLLSFKTHENYILFFIYFYFLKDKIRKCIIFKVYNYQMDSHSTEAVGASKYELSWSLSSSSMPAFDFLIIFWVLLFLGHHFFFFDEAKGVKFRAYLYFLFIPNFFIVWLMISLINIFSFFILLEAKYLFLFCIVKIF